MTHDLSSLCIVPPVPTPLKENGSIDLPAVARIARHLENGGIDAAFVLGSTGELASLSHAKRLEVISSACETYNIPVIVGIGDTCIDESLDLARAAASSGAAAVVLNAPAYYEISTSEMCGYLDRILPQIQLPVYLYNMPWLTGYSFDRETVRCGLAHPGVIGFKDSSGQIDCLKMLIGECVSRPEIRIFAGNEFLYLEGLKAGAHGVVGGGGNLYPALFRELLNAFIEGDMETAAARQKQISQLGERIFSLSGNPCSGFATIKAGMASLGLCEPFMAPPLQTCTPDVREAVASILHPSAAA